MTFLEFCKTDSYSWDSSDLLYFYRGLSHLLGNLDKRNDYKDRLRSLDLSRLSPEAVLVAKCAFHDVPAGLRFLSKKSLAALLTVGLPSEPVVLTADKDLEASPYKRYGVIF